MVIKQVCASDWMNDCRWHTRVLYWSVPTSTRTSTCPFHASYSVGSLKRPVLSRCSKCFWSWWLMDNVTPLTTEPSVHLTMMSNTGRSHSQKSKVCSRLYRWLSDGLGITLRCGGLFNYRLTIYLPLSLVVKKFLMVNASQSYRQKVD